jgi:hypothetical protein
MVNSGLKTPVICKIIKMQGFSARDQIGTAQNRAVFPTLPGPGRRLGDGFKIPARELKYADPPGWNSESSSVTLDSLTIAMTG